MITTHGLCKRFGSRVVLAGLDTRIRCGRVTALIGPNGAGKTTLLKLLLGLARPDAGTISLDGVPLTGAPSYRAQIGYMPQIAHFPAHRTGRELLALLQGLRAEGSTTELSLAEAFGLGCDFDRPLGTLSGGTRQKINAILALAFAPSHLILDEPTAGLDPLANRVLKDRIIAERDKGRAVLVTSHVIPELEELADDVVFLDGGRAHWQGSVAELLEATSQRRLDRAIASLLGTRSPSSSVAS